MSVENAKKLLSDLKANPDLKQKLKGAGSAGFRQSASQAGYDCTPDELATAVKEVATESIKSGDAVFAASDGIVSGVSSGVSSHVSAVGTGIA